MHRTTEWIVFALSMSSMVGCGTRQGESAVKSIAKTWPAYRQPTFVEASPPTAADGTPTTANQVPTTLRPNIVQTRHQGVSQPQLTPAVKPVAQWGLEETAIDSLGRIGAAAVPGLIQALEHPEPAKRLRAARVIARIGPEAGQAVPILVQLLNDQDESIRKAAAWALGQIGPAAESAVDPLLEMIQ